VSQRLPAQFLSEGTKSEGREFAYSEELTNRPQSKGGENCLVFSEEESQNGRKRRGGGVSQSDTVIREIIAEEKRCNATVFKLSIRPFLRVHLEREERRRKTMYRIS